VSLQEVFQTIAQTDPRRPAARLCLGTAFYKVEEQDYWFEMLDAFVARGGRLIDTAHHYGTSEQVIGEWLRRRQLEEVPVIMTKCGHGDNLMPDAGFEDMVTQEVAKSFELLGIARLDVLGLHRDNTAVSVERVIDRLHQEVAEGRVGALAASNWTYDRIDAANTYAAANGLTPFSIVSNNLSLALSTEPFFPNLVSTGAAGEEWHTRTGIPLVPWSAQARGFFTGRWTPEWRDNRTGEESGFDNRMLDVYTTDANYERYRRAKQLGEEKGGYTAIEIALAWLLARPFPVIPIIGPHTSAELESCLRALEIELSETEQSWLNLAEG
jgi:aryl-alcohol dehydrogenase-like predicted oxidoreductase